MEKNSLENHKKQHLNEELIPCERCDEKFATKRAFYKHMRVIIKNHGLPRFICSVCDEEFSNKSDLSHHIKSIHDGKVFMCDICQSLHRDMSALKGHRMTHSQIKNFECNVCGKKYSCKDTLRFHMNFEHNGIGYECEICDKSFPSPAGLKRHLLTHSDKKMKCNHCDKAFHHKINLNSHISTVHLKLKPFKCNECGKNFAMKKNLTRHISAVHNEIKDYQCKVCQHKFSKNYQLKRHMHKVHSSEVLSDNSLKEQRKELIKTLDKTNVTPSAIYNQQTNSDRHISSTHFIDDKSGSVKINASSSFSNQQSANSTQFNDKVPFEIQRENSNQLPGNQDVSFTSFTNQAPYIILSTANNIGYINPSPSQTSMPDNFNNLQATDVQSERNNIVSEKFILNQQVASTIPYHSHQQFSLIPSERNFQNIHLTSMQRESLNNTDIHFPTLNQSQIVLNKFNQH